MRSTASRNTGSRAPVPSSAKTFGNRRSDGWVIVAAGNPPEYNKSVQDFDVVTLDRVKKIPVEPEFDVWKEYAYKEENPSGSTVLSEPSSSYFLQDGDYGGGKFATPEAGKIFPGSSRSMKN